MSGRQRPVDSVRRRRLVTSSAAVDERRYLSALGHAAFRLVATDEVAPVLADVIVRQIEPATEAPPALYCRAAWQNVRHRTAPSGRVVILR